MDFKKILALTIIVLAVFSCLSVASAGWFDFMGEKTQVKNQTYVFDGFTLEYAEGANFSNHTLDVNGTAVKNYATEYSPDGRNSYIMLIQLTNGKMAVKSGDDFKRNWTYVGAKDTGNYGSWYTFDIKPVPEKYLNFYGIDANVTRYIFAYYKNDTQMVLLEGSDFDELKNVADTYRDF